MKSFGDRLRAARRAAGQSQAALGRLVGVTQTYISELEAGKKERPSYDIIRRLTAAVGAPLTEPAAYSVPLVGAVGAGPAVDDAAPAGERLVVNDLFPGDVVAYTVRGRSMEADGMLPGDYIIVRRSPDPAPGELVVVWVKSLGGTVVKRLKGRGAKRWLESGDGWRHDLAADDRVYGAYAGVIRKGRP